MKSLKPLLEQAKTTAIDELNQRRLARNHLIDFTTYTKKEYHIGQHHRLLCDKLELVEQGKIKRLMVFMPPRHGKSELASKRFPAWFLGRNPTKQVILTSYTAKLATSFGRDVRNIVRLPLFQKVFPDIFLSKDSSSKNLWHTDKGGIFLSSGVGGSITGYGADLAIIDDPIKGRQEAESQLQRNALWDWYKSVLRTRLMPNGAVILVMTRWHVDDLAGRLLRSMQEGTGENWEILHLPALARSQDILGRSVGDPLWPEAFDHASLISVQKTIGDKDFQALYQGQPMMTTGSIFKTSKITIIDAAPKHEQMVRRWDFAASKAIGTYDPDWTVGVKMQRDLDGGYTILDVVRFRGRPDEVEKTVMAVASQDGKQVRIVIPQDPGQAGVAQAQYYTRLLAGYRIETIRETGDKTTRADPFAAQVNMGNVSLLQGAWNDNFIDELTAFPSAAHDDQVDAASGAFERLVGKKALPKMPSFINIAKI